MLLADDAGDDDDDDDNDNLYFTRNVSIKEGIEVVTE